MTTPQEPLSHEPLSQRPHDAHTGFAVKHLAIIAIFIALSAVGALVKIPSPLGTIALDAAPGFFVAIGFSSPAGAIVALAGHLLTAATSGFPMSVPVHIAIAVGMGICALVFGVLSRIGRWGWIGGFIVTAVLNSFALGLIMIPLGGAALYLANIVPLLVGAVINLAIATIAWFALRSTRLVQHW